MTRTFILRLLGVLGLALGLSLAVTAGSASAQIAMGGPYGPTGANSGQSQIQTQPSTFRAPNTNPGSQIQNGTQGGGGVSAQDVSAAASCGFFVDRSDHHYAKYNHCGSSPSIKIRVSFWYGWSTRDIWVGRYVTNLSTHSQLQGAGMITNAWCIERCW
ncbi:hypothetical protein ADK67_14760 [Saccharothrix sp. NRRL B-16348]|uniref:DUF6355 family natural product biosynthesis protein n=1 Tax=Saccharothrix sp. NRRL B-16348 TaxID=1415542 RepID=UPI0006AE5781|nr:DUF6355 family natural product biosynthesis protein [Saccharothrix sp. NRRL B-16348]KOX27079.1 hypothetical protein ADK67_14760 [Saccharothrix sp. NRRL B-16348]